MPSKLNCIVLIIFLLTHLQLNSQCYSKAPDRIALFSPFLNSNPRIKKKIPTEYFGDSSRKTTRTCNGRGIVHTGNGYYLDIGEPVFAPISGIAHIYTLGSNEMANNTKTGVWIESNLITINFQGIQTTISDGQFINKGQIIGKGFDNYGEAGVYFTIRNAPPQNPTVKRSFLPMVENPSSPCKCNNEPVFPEYFINPDAREIDYNEYNEIIPDAEITVQLQPSGIGMWSIDNGQTWNSSGTILRGMPYLYYKILFRNEYGYITPLPLEYNLAQGENAVILQAKYSPDYTIIPRPLAERENEKFKSELQSQLTRASDSLHSNVIFSVNTIISDTIKQVHRNVEKKIIDSLNRKYKSLEEIQKQQLAISQIFKYLLPIMLLLMIALAIYYLQNRKIRKQKKTLELMQTEQHHRVYNNLGIIAGLVSDYGAEIGENKISDLRNSILAIAKVHAQLYKGDSLETIYLNNLFTEIGNNIIGQRHHDKSVLLQVNCPIYISQVKATKLALIINELLTNSHKYGKSSLQPEVHIIGFRQDADIFIQYSDNGPGYMQVPNPKIKLKGTGMILCFGLAKDLGAVITFYNDNGANCLIKCKA